MLTKDHTNAPAPSHPVLQTGRMVLLRGLLAFVMLVAVVLIFADSKGLTLAGMAALGLYLILTLRQFSAGTWVPVLLSLLTLIVALFRGVPAAVLWQASDRMLFLSALIAFLGTLRSSAALAPEVHRAGQYVTNQPASRRYLAMTFGGHLFGVLINFGGLAVLLDMAKRAISTEAAAQMTQEARNLREKRMTLAVIRGFSLIALWSPFGFATNAILITLPGISYFDFGPIGFAMSFVFIAVGWSMDRWEGRRYRRMGLPPPSPPPRSWAGAALLLCHVGALGAAVFIVHDLSRLNFQQALILVVPCYSVFWAAIATRRAPGGPVAGIKTATRTSWQRLSGIGGEIGVFASAGFLPVVLLALIPSEALRDAIAALGFGPLILALGLLLMMVVIGLLGVNPIVVASVLGAIATQLEVPGLNDTIIALAISGGWAAVMGFSPFITTVIIGAAIMGRSPARLGLFWNGPYCMAILAVWAVLLTALIQTGLI